MCVGAAAAIIESAPADETDGDDDATKAKCDDESLALPTQSVSASSWHSRGEIDTDSLDDAAAAPGAAAATAADSSVRMDEEEDKEETEAADHPNDDENVSALAAAAATAADSDSIGECMNEDADAFTDVGAKVEHVESTISDGRRRDRFGSCSPSSSS